MVKPEYFDEEEFSTSDGKSIEEEEGVEGLDGWRTVSIRNFKVKSSDGDDATVDRQRHGHNRFVGHVDPLVIDSDTGKECGLHSCTSTNSSSSSNESSLHMSSTNHHDAKIVMLHGDGGDDKRVRRQIANSNERRRMQSINQGFQSLRQLLPNRKDGDKMSKAAILSATAELIQTLQVEKIRLEGGHEENELAAQAKRQRLDFQHQPSEELMEVGDACSLSAASERGTTSIPASLQSSIFECLHTIDELRMALAKEQQMRAVLEQELMAVRKNSGLGVEQSPLLAICQQPQPQLSPQTLVFNGGYSAGVRQQAPSMESPQQSSLIASALTSAFSTLREHVFGSKLPATGCAAAEDQHLSSILAPIPNGCSPIGSGLLFNRLESSSLSEGHHFLLAQTSPDVKHSQMRDCHVQKPMTGMSVGQGLPQNGDGLSVSQRNLQAILEAIRHIEGGEAIQSKN